MNDSDNYHLATLMESVRHHAGIAAKPYHHRERVFHLLQAKAKCEEGLMILTNNEGDLGGETRQPVKQ